jgi:hypothetical protein
MSLSFSEFPGRHERHYRRRLDNPLFGSRTIVRDDDSLLEAQRLDHEELLGFLRALRAAMQQAVDLKPNEDSEVILALKERLDRLYEQSAGLADQQSHNQAAIAELIEVIMRNVERGASGDPRAVDELQQERQARTAHYALLREALVADLLHPESVVEKDDLAPTLLSADRSALDAALALFDAAQLAAIYAEAERCLERFGGGAGLAAERLGQIGDRLSALRRSVPLN